MDHGFVMLYLKSILQQPVRNLNQKARPRKVIMSLAKQSRTDRQFMVPYRESKWFGLQKLQWFGYDKRTDTLWLNVFLLKMNPVQSQGGGFKHFFVFSFWHLVFWSQSARFRIERSVVFNLRLTILLRDAIGGSGYTLMLACLSMLDSNFEENLSTLQYATWMNLLTTLFFVNKTHGIWKRAWCTWRYLQFCCTVLGKIHTVAMESPAWNSY